jgi:hypothetical protein
MAAGSCMFAVVSVIQASVQDTSSSLSVIVVLLGGSVVLQDVDSKIRVSSASEVMCKNLLLLTLCNKVADKFKYNL